MMNNEKKRHSLFVEDFWHLIKIHMNYNRNFYALQLSKTVDTQGKRLRVYFK